MIASNNVDDLFETVRRAAEELIKRMKEKGYDIGISSTYRDTCAQDAIYAQGRTAPGAIITQNKGGESMHNYHLAFDIFQNKKGDEYNSNVLHLAGTIAEEMGLEWGCGKLNFLDLTHMQWTGGLTLADLQRGETPENQKLKWEEGA